MEKNIMNKKKQIKYPKNRLAFLTAILAICALLICLGLVLLINHSKNKQQIANDEAKEMAALENMVLEENEEDVMLKLENVQKYLETLESSVSDSTLKINTLVKTNESEVIKKEDEIRKSSEYEKRLTTKLVETENQLKNLENEIALMKTETFEVMESIKAENKDDSKGISERIAGVYEGLENIKSQADSACERLKELDNDNSQKVISIVKNFETNLNKANEIYQTDIEKTMADIKKMIEKDDVAISEKIDNSRKEQIENSTKQFDAMKTMLDQYDKEINQKVDDNHKEQIENTSQQFDTVRTMLDQHDKDITQKVDDSYKAQSENTTAQFGSMQTMIDQHDKDIAKKIDDSYKAQSDSTTKLLAEIKGSLDQVFGLVANGKKSIASALATIGRKLDKDAVLSFTELTNMIIHSQDIEGTYKDSALGERPLGGAISDNMPVGKAAWVGGKYIIGNGKDINDAFAKGRNEGYNSGYTDGMNKVMKGLEVKYVYHVHSGSSKTGGGCYTVPIYHQHVDKDGIVRPADYQASKAGGCFNNPVKYSDSCDCREKGHYVYGKIVDWNGDPYYSDYCEDCDHWCGYYDSYYYTCNCNQRSQVVGYELGCGKTASTIESATIIFNQSGAKKSPPLTTMMMSLDGAKKEGAQNDLEVEGTKELTENQKLLQVERISENMDELKKNDIPENADGIKETSEETNATKESKTSENAKMEGQTISNPLSAIEENTKGTDVLKTAEELNKSGNSPKTETSNESATSRTEEASNEIGTSKTPEASDESGTSQTAEASNEIGTSKTPEASDESGTSQTAETSDESGTSQTAEASNEIGTSKTPEASNESDTSQTAEASNESDSFESMNEVDDSQTVKASNESGNSEMANGENESGNSQKTEESSESGTSEAS